MLCMYKCMYLRMQRNVGNVGIYVCMYVMYVCMYVFMYVMYVCMYLMYVRM